MFHLKRLLNFPSLRPFLSLAPNDEIVEDKDMNKDKSIVQQVKAVVASPEISTDNQLTHSPSTYGINRVPLVRPETKTKTIYNQGLWRYNPLQQSSQPKPLTPEELILCQTIDYVRQDLVKLSSSSKHFCLPQQGDEDCDTKDEPVIYCQNFTFKNKPSPQPDETVASSTQDQPLSLPELRLFVSPEEHGIIPFLYGLPFVTIASFNPGDFILTADGRPLTVYERKTTHDLSNNIGKKYKQQRERLKRMSVSREQITILEEFRIPTSRTKKLSTLEAAASNAVHRDGFRWRRTRSLLHTVLLLLQDVRSVLKEGSRQWNKKKRRRDDQPVFSTPLEPHGGDPKSYAGGQHIWPRMLSAIPSCSVDLGHRFQKVFPSPRHLLDELQAQMTDESRLKVIQRVPGIGRKRSQSILEVFWTQIPRQDGTAPKRKKQKRGRAKTTK